MFNVALTKHAPAGSWRASDAVCAGARRTARSSQRILRKGNKCTPVLNVNTGDTCSCNGNCSGYDECVDSQCCVPNGISCGAGEKDGTNLRCCSQKCSNGQCVNG